MDANGKSFSISPAGSAPIRVNASHFAPMQKIEPGNTVARTGVVTLQEASKEPSILLRELNRLSPPASDALAFYSFEEDGESAAESSPNHQDAKVINGGTRIAGKLGKALQLDGEKAYLQVPNLGLQTALTVAMWVNLSDYAKDTFASVMHCDGWNWGDFHWNVAKDNKRDLESLPLSPDV